jgi:hypothetical protein
MSLRETILAAIAEEVFNYALDQNQGIVEDWKLKKLNLASKQLTYFNVLSEVYEKFEKQYPHWAADLIGVGFIKEKEVPMLAQFFIRDSYRDPSELATHWAELLDVAKSKHYAALNWELETAACDFLDSLVKALKTEQELSISSSSLVSQYVMQGMNETQIRDFLEHWCPIVETALRPDVTPQIRDAKAQQEVENIMKAVRLLGASLRIADWTSLRLIAQFHRCGEPLPHMG